MPASSPIRVAILTSSDRAAAGIYADKSGPALQALLSTAFEVRIVDTQIVPDHQATIAACLRNWADSHTIDLILTTGGTGFAPSDVTPEATREVIEKEAPGLAEAMRSAALAITPHAMLSRAVAGIRRETLIINLPGSPKGAQENLQAILPIIPHAIELLRNSPNSEAGHHYQGSKS